MASLAARQNAEVREKLAAAQREADEANRAADAAMDKEEASLSSDLTAAAMPGDSGIGNELLQPANDLDEAFREAVGGVLRIIEEADRIHSSRLKQQHDMHARMVARFDALRDGKIGVDRLPLTGEERQGLEILRHLIGDAQLELSQGEVNSLRAFAVLLEKIF